MSPDVRTGGVSRLVIVLPVGQLTHAVADLEQLCQVIERLAPLIPDDAEWSVSPS